MAPVKQYRGCLLQQKILHYRTCRGGEMADAPALGAGGSNPVEVQVLSPAPVVTCSELRIWSDFAEAKI